MADEERDRVGWFRQRWAHENFESGRSSPAHPQNQTAGGQNGLSEISARRPVRQDAQSNRAQVQSWRESLRRSTSRLAPISAPQPISDASTSIRSPVDSQDNTIYSHTRADGEATAETSGQSPSKVGELTYPAWMNELYTLSWLTFFALLGTLARLGVETITQYPDAPVTSRVLWANLGGSLIMGFLVEDRNLFGIPSHLDPTAEKGEDPVDEQKIHSIHLKHKKTIPFYTGLTVGFCGCFTSFSSFISDAFLALTNALPTSNATIPYRSSVTPPAHRNAGFSFEALVAILIIHPAVALAALKVGGHLALAVRPILPRQILSANIFIKFVNPMMVFVSFGCWILGSLFLTIFTPSSGPSPVNWRARATIPLLFSPPGCWLRFYLSKYLNRPSTPNFPWGTFVANVFGTFVFGMAWDLQHARSIGAAVNNGNACAVLLGVQQGFCGCLTTVSTWAVELNGLNWRPAWIYGLSSVIISLAGLVIIEGSMGWTIGFGEPVCG